MPIHHLTTPHPEPRILATFHPPVAHWWQSKFPAMSRIQTLAIPSIAAGHNTLICAPTGTGKTLTAFIAILSDLLARAAQRNLPNTIDTLYISPLRALGTDIQRNLLTPLAEIAAQTAPTSPTRDSLTLTPTLTLNPPLGPQSSEPLQSSITNYQLPITTPSLIRVAQRTGDTSAKERTALTKRPPHILITTPESLALCLVSPKLRPHLTAVRRIIIDELHALAPAKRGTDLMLSLERLTDLVLRHNHPAPQRLGLSATIAPLESMAHFLTGGPPKNLTLNLTPTLNPQLPITHYQLQPPSEISNLKSQIPTPIENPLPSITNYQLPITTPPSLTQHSPPCTQHLPRDCHIADASFDRPLDLNIASIFSNAKGSTPFSTTANINRNVYDLLEKTIRQNRTTLIFTNVRSATERVTFALRKRFANSPTPTTSLKSEISNLKSIENQKSKMGGGENSILPDHIQAHHSSLDRDLRLDIERRLKAGELRCVVCSTSLELGIDIGTIDHVVLLNSPKGVARGLQRIGRSGHHLAGTARGTLIPTVPADLIEAIVTAQAMRQRAVDTISWPQNPLDVLAQHLIGMTLQESPHGLDPDHAYQVITQSAPYNNLPREKFDQVLRYLSSNDLRDTAWITPKLTLDRQSPDWPLASESSDISLSSADTCSAASTQLPITNYQLQSSPPSIENQKSKIENPPHPIPYTLNPIPSRLHPRSRSLLPLFAQNVGTITAEAQVKVRLESHGTIGTVEEAFAQMLKPGDRFVLAGRCVQFQSAKAMSIHVTDSAGQSPTIPRWFSGMMSLEPGLTRRMHKFAHARAAAPAGTTAIERMLMRKYQVAPEVAAPAAAYLHAQHRYAEIPVDGQLLVERIPDESETGNATVLVFHTLLGRATNDALARAVAYRMSQRFGGKPLHHRPNQNSVGGATVVVDDYAFGIWIDATGGATGVRRADRTLIRSLLSPVNFETDLLAAVESSELFRSHFRSTALRAHALLQNRFGKRRFIGQMQSYAGRLYEALKSHHPNHLLLEQTRYTIMNEILYVYNATLFLQNLTTQSLRLLDLPTPSPFAFGLFAAGSSRRDTLQLADTADFLLAMYQQIRQNLPPETAPAQAELFV